MIDSLGPLGPIVVISAWLLFAVIEYRAARRQR